jgi:hypothetical protein
MRRALFIATALLTLLPAAALAHQGNPSYRSEITSVKPEIPGLQLEVLNYDDNLSLKNDTGKEVVVYGYNDEPYARIEPDGTVEVNRNSPATYLNEDRQAATPVPANASGEATPDWELLDKTGRFQWHDHRIHYMGAGLPPQVKDKAVPVKVFDWKVPLEVDGRPVEVTGTLRWVPLPGGGPPLAAVIGLGVIVIAAILFVVFVRRRRGRTEPKEAW